MKFVWVILILLSSLSLSGEGISIQKKDTAKVAFAKKDPNLFYDSLEVKASRNQVTRWIFNKLISTTKKEAVNPELQSYEYYRTYEKK